MLSVGDAFPDFSLTDQNGNTVTKAALAGKKAVVYFYPKDDTPGCTQEACEFQERLPSFQDVTVLGVSPDDEKSHLKFATKFNLTFSLLADPNRTLIEACGLWVEKSMYGKKYMGVERSTFILDESGVVTHAYPKVKPAGHAHEIAAALGLSS